MNLLAHFATIVAVGGITASASAQTLEVRHTAPDNRRTAIAWMSNREYADVVPTLQFRSANTLPRDLELFRVPDGSLRLGVKPAKEVESLRRGKTTYPAATLSASPVVCTLPAEADGVCEIELALDFGRARKIDLVLANEAGESVRMTCDVHDAKKRTFAMYRQQSGATDFSLAFPATTVAPMLQTGHKCTLRIFLDRCSVEVFGDDGEFAMTNLVFPSSPYTSLTLSSEGGAARRWIWPNRCRRGETAITRCNNSSEP